MLRVAAAPEKNLMSVFNEHGVIRPTSQHFPKRFREAFINELSEFISCIKESHQPDVTVFYGLQGTKVAIALQQSVEINQIVELKN